MWNVIFWIVTPSNLACNIRTSCRNLQHSFAKYVGSLTGYKVIRHHKPDGHNHTTDPVAASATSDVLRGGVR
jgi:hypothetical protein